MRENGDVPGTTCGLWGSLMKTINTTVYLRLWVPPQLSVPGGHVSFWFCCTFPELSSALNRLSGDASSARTSSCHFYDSQLELSSKRSLCLQLWNGDSHCYFCVSVHWRIMDHVCKITCRRGMIWQSNTNNSLVNVPYLTISSFYSIVFFYHNSVSLKKCSFHYL